MGVSRSMVTSTMLSVLLALVLLSGLVVDARQMRKDELKQRQLEAAKRFNAPVGRRATSPGVKNITFANPKAAGESCFSSETQRDTDGCHTLLLEFLVNGTAIPEVDFDIGLSWAGLLPISDKANESRQV